VLATAAAVATVGLVPLTGQHRAGAATPVLVDGATTYQTIDGFGVSEAFGMANAIRTLGATPRQQALDLLFNKSNGAGFSILRSLIPSDGGSIEPTSPGSPGATPRYVWTGDDGQDQGQLWLAKQAKNSYGVGTFYNDAWSAPGYMKTNGSESGGGSLCGTPGASCGSGDWRQAYANYLTQHARYWSQAGVAPNYVGFVNEPSLTTSYSSMLANPSQAASFLSVLGPTLQASGLSTRAACCDTLGFTLLPSYVSAVVGNAAVQLFTSHGYSNPPTTPVAAQGRHVWESEWGVNGSTWTNTWDGSGEATGITWAQRIQTALTGANVNGFLYWWGISNTHHDSALIGLTGSTLDPSKRFYALSNYSRYIRPGAVRIGASGGDGALRTSAFRNTDGSVVVVVLNTGTGAVSSDYALSGVDPVSGTVAPYLTNGSASMAAQAAIPLSAGRFSATVPARSLVTYRITGGSPPVTVTPPPTTTPPPGSTTPPPATTTPPPGSGSCSAAYTVTDSWNGGFVAAVTVTAGSAPISRWRVTLTLPGGSAVTNVWNGVAGGTGGTVAVDNESYNGALAAGATTSFGLQGTGPGTGATTSCTAG
jgi:O-glycosyl hydrolase